jgi:hypothetical protein
MCYRDAAKLHNGDEVIVKSSIKFIKKVRTVITTRVCPRTKVVEIDIMDPVDGFTTLVHTDVR